MNLETNWDYIAFFLSLTFAFGLMEMPRFLIRTKRAFGKTKVPFVIVGMLPFGRTIVLSIMLKGTLKLFRNVMIETIALALPFVIGQAIFWRDIRVAYFLALVCYVGYLRYVVKLDFFQCKVDAILDDIALEKQNKQKIEDTEVSKKNK